MFDFNIHMFNPQPEPPPHEITSFSQMSRPPEPVGLLVPAVQAAR